MSLKASVYLTKLNGVIDSRPTGNEGFKDPSQSETYLDYQVVEEYKFVKEQKV